MLICVSANGGVETRWPKPALRMLVATIEGIAIFERADEKSRWRFKKIVRPDFHVAALLVVPEAGQVFCGNHGGGGLWRSKDLGETWTRVDIPRPHIYSVQCQYLPSGPRLWVGTEPVGLYYSDDLGDTWTELESLRHVPEHENWTFPSPPHVGHVKGVSWHDKRPERLFVLVEQGGLYVTDDLGGHWREIKGYLIGDQKFYRDAHRLWMAPSDPDWMIFATGDGLCRSEDGGETWEYVIPRKGRIGYPDALFIDPFDENKIVVAGPESEGAPRYDAKATVLVSYDRGDTFVDVGETMGAPLRGNIEAMGLYVTPTHATYLAGTAVGELFISEDGCESWVLLDNALPPISKAGHYRWYLTDEERAAVEQRMNAWKKVEA